MDDLPAEPQATATYIQERIKIEKESQALVDTIILKVLDGLISLAAMNNGKISVRDLVELRNYVEEGDNDAPSQDTPADPDRV